MANNLAEIYTRIYFILAEQSTSATFDKNNLVIPMINEVQSDIVKGIVSDETTGRTIKAGDLRFARKQFPIQNVPVGNLTTAIVSTDTTITIGDTTNYQATGALLILGMVVNYTGKTATQFMGVVGIDRDIPVGTSVKQVRKMPSDYSYAFNLEYVRSTITVQLNQSPYYNNFVIYRDFRGPKDLYFYYSLIGDNTNDETQYLTVNGYNSTQDRFILHYYKTSTDMVNDADLTDLPDNYGVQVIAPIVAGKLLLSTDEIGKATTILKQGYKNLEGMYSYYGTMIKEYRTKVHCPAIPKYYGGMGSRTTIINF